MSSTIERASCVALAGAIFALTASAAQAQFFEHHWKRPWWGDEERMDRATADGGATAARRDFDRQYEAYLFGPRCWHEAHKVRVRGGWAPRVVKVCR